MIIYNIITHANHSCGYPCYEVYDDDSDWCWIDDEKQGFLVRRGNLELGTCTARDAIEGPRMRDAWQRFAADDTWRVLAGKWIW